MGPAEELSREAELNAPTTLRARRDVRLPGAVFAERMCDSGDAGRELSGVGIGVISLDVVPLFIIVLAVLFIMSAQFFLGRVESITFEHIWYRWWRRFIKSIFLLNAGRWSELCRLCESRVCG